MKNKNFSLRIQQLASRAVLCAFLGFGLSHCSTLPLEKKDESLPLVGQYKVNRYVLKNGLKLVVLEDHSSPTFAYQTWFNVGSRDEKIGKTGLAHLFEHMMFKETKSFKEGQFDKMLEEAGAEGENAFTTRDVTAYVQEMPRDKLELIVKLEAERMVNLVVNEKAFKTETEVVQNERRFSYENNPDGLMFHALFETAFTKHPYRWPVIGYEEDLNKMTAQDGLEFYKRHYAPNNATVVVVGSVKTSEVLSLFEKYYSMIPSVELDQTPLEVEPEQTQIRRQKLALNLQIEKVYMAWHVPGVMSPEAPVFEVIQALLTTGKSARLTRALIDTGIATSVETGSYQQRDPTLFMVGATLQKGKRATMAEDVVLKEISKLASQPPSDKELAKSKTQIRFGFIDSLGSNSERARFIGGNETSTGHFQNGLKLHEQIEKVTADDIKRVVTAYLDPNRRTVIRGVPK